MIATIVTWLVKLGFGGIVDKTIDLMKYRAQLENDKEKLRTEVAIEQLKATLEETRIMAGYNEKKLEFPWFWLMACIFVLPLGMWWSAILLDSIFHFGWRVADLPTQNLQDWAGQMITWIFYVGSGVAVLKGLRK
jgi:hypothetical protein